MQKLKKNDRIVATCTTYAFDGMGIVKIDGFILFVKNMCMGDEGEILVTKILKRHGYGKLMKLQKRSLDRIDPPCIYAQVCGGCQLQHLHYNAQVAFKKNKIIETMQRIANIPIEEIAFIPATHTANYRNKAQFPIAQVDEQARCGFYRIHSHTIVNIEYCMIQSKRINEILATMHSLLQKYPIASTLRHLLIKDAFALQQVMVVLIAKQKTIPYMQEIKQTLCTKHPYIQSILIQVNNTNDNVILSDEQYTIYQQPYIHDQLFDVTVRISPNAFYQVNPQQMHQLYECIKIYAEIDKSTTIIDLYCGVGSIALYLARDAGSLIGVEIVANAIADAKKNAQENKLDNVEFICSDVKTFATHFQKTQRHCDVVIVDPPRKGCDIQTLQSIVNIAPQKLIYVSCDPATLARDVAYLTKHGFQVAKICGVDMFPHTYHIETIVKLIKNK